MYLWNTRKLASDLKHGRVSEKDKMLYMLGNQLLITISIYEALFQNQENDFMGLIELLVASLIVIYGIVICYSANGKEEGRNFIEKFVCLSLPISIKLTLLAWTIGLILGNMAANGITKFYPMINFLLSMLITYVFFWRISWHLRIISKESGLSVANPRI